MARTNALRLVRDDDSRPPDLDLIAEWMRYLIACGATPATHRTYKMVLQGLVNHAGVSDPLTLTRSHVVAYLARDISPWSRLTYWKAIRKWSEWLRLYGHDPDSDLTRGMPRPKRPAPHARPISDEVVERMLDLRLGPRSHAYVRLALFAALRVHEIAQLKAEQLDLAAGWLTVTGKGNYTASIPVHPEVAKLAVQMPTRGYWFPSDTPLGHVRPIQVSVTITEVLRRCGAATATAHMLRDTCATRVQRAVGDIRITQSMLRHRDVSSTMKYTQVADQDLRRAMGSLDWSHMGPAAPAAPATPPLPDLATMTAEQLRLLAAQVLGALAEQASTSGQ